ncbi:tetraprenyl-beta-curcumene synthase family protein [Nostoc sp. DedQUE09]|uniref:tetraprenyl-beta-curcumene synthase family protein n=1 Tax=Nostoc sp. DedQUE09 TaxID=3075394 RepID=UPI002AD22CA6|nr:tetraprenyl-beta-curcumene synthase family protein [Nostoc sp. DedQUE09]MDZ7955331.1 tetraprenyl-beta-curcumene synthase family protein [Nostoc sp. DedQUE09]
MFVNQAHNHNKNNKDFLPKVLLLQVPSSSAMLMLRIYYDVIPRVHKHLKFWKKKAERIPDPELRKQALLSIKTKAFHCEGGSIYGLLAKQQIEQIICFIVAYQTISDYLDNLCDRSTSLDPKDFRTLHQACLDALTPSAKCINYYQFRQEQDDGGYLMELVKTCQNVLRELPSYHVIAPSLYHLANYYCDLQVHKHVQVNERVPRLEAWFERHRNQIPQMKWYEFSASTGSTLGIFCLVAYASDPDCSEELATKVKTSYFPWVQGLHILLDYFIDQEEDRIGGDLNFCAYYNNGQEISERFAYFLKQADQAVSRLPHKHFHRMINRALLSVYLADEKVNEQKNIKKTAKKILRSCGGSSLFFLWNIMIMARIRYRKILVQVV